MSTSARRSILIAYEDAYYKELHLLIKALRRDSGLPGIILEGRPVCGTGNFVKEAQELLRIPLKQTKLPPDRVVCLADADRTQNLCVTGATPEPPLGATGAELAEWVLAFESSWQKHLERACHLSEEQASRLSVCCLRWNKESLLVACPEALLAHAESRRAEIEALLKQCALDPRSLADAEFVVKYRSPEKCLDRVFQAIFARSYKKGRDDEDLLRERLNPVPARRAELLQRCPDLERLLALLA